MSCKYCCFGTAF